MRYRPVVNDFLSMDRKSAGVSNRRRIQWMVCSQPGLSRLQIETRSLSAIRRDEQTNRVSEPDRGKRSLHRAYTNAKQ